MASGWRVAMVFSVGFGSMRPTPPPGFRSVSAVRDGGHRLGSSRRGGRQRTRKKYPPRLRRNRRFRALAIACGLSLRDFAWPVGRPEFHRAERVYAVPRERERVSNRRNGNAEGITY